MTGDDERDPAGPDLELVKWQLAVDAAGVGAFDWDLVTGALRWDDRLLAVFGTTRERWGGTIEAFNAMLHPDDVPRVTAAIDHAVRTCGEYAARYRVLSPTGLRWVDARGRAVAGPDGSAVRLLGAAYDVTAAVDAETSVSRVLESMPTAFYHLDLEWRFSFLNGHAEQLLQRSRHELLGRVVWEAFPATLGSDFERLYLEAMVTGEPVAFDAYYPAPLDGWYEVRAWPNPEGLGVYFNEITGRVRAQQQMEVIAARDELLSRVTAELTGTLDPREALRRLARLLVPRLGSAAAATLVDTAALDGRYAVVRQVASWQEQEERGVVPVDVDEAARFLSADHVAALDHDRAVPLAGDPALRQALLAGALTEVTAPVVALPLRGRERLVGVVVVAAPDGTHGVHGTTGTHGFTPEELETLSAVATRAGLAVDNARLFAEQRDLAEGLQRSLLSQAPHPEGLEVAVRYEAAAETAQVGGDWYDAFVLECGDTVLVVGDVVGHDTEAAAAMGQMRSLLRGIAVHGEEGPADLLRGVDRVLARLGTETTATALVARISGTPDADGSREVRWSCAGHPPPVVRDADGTARVLTDASPDLLLGLDPGAPRSESVVGLATGSVLLMFTDGLVERRGEDLDLGFDRLCATADGLGAPPEDGLAWWCDGLVTQMVPGRREDDVALVAVRVGHGGRGGVEVSSEPAPQDVTAVLLPAEPASVGRARAVVREALEEAGTVVVSESRRDGSVVDEAVLATSELVTNALVHAGTSVLLRVAAGPCGVRVEVIDGSAHSPVPRWHAVTSATGRGLRLVDSLVDRWDVSRRADGKAVWFQIGAPPGLDVPDDVVVAPGPSRRVVLAGLPLALHDEWQESAASTLREHLLLVLEEEPGALEAHAAASDALDLLREKVPPVQEGGGGYADVELDVPVRSVASFEVLERRLAEAGRVERDGQLLGPATSAELDRFRSWVCQEVARQAGQGARARSWGVPA